MVKKKGLHIQNKRNLVEFVDGHGEQSRLTGEAVDSRKCLMCVASVSNRTLRKGHWLLGQLTNAPTHFAVTSRLGNPLHSSPLNHDVVSDARFSLMVFTRIL